MAYDFSMTRPRESNVQPGSLGIKIVDLLMQGKQMSDNRAMQVEQAKQTALDRVVDQQHQEKLFNLISQFPVEPTPSSYDQAVNQGTSPSANASDLYDTQMKWMSQNAYKFAQVKGGTQWFDQLQQQANTARRMQLTSELHGNANTYVKERQKLFEMGLEYNDENRLLVRNNEAHEKVRAAFEKAKVPIPTTLPAGTIVNGIVNQERLNSLLSKAQEDQVSIENVPNTGHEYDIRRMVVLKPRVAALEEALRNAQTQEEDTAIRSQLNPLREELNLREQRQAQKNDSPVTSTLSPEVRALFVAKQKEILEGRGDKEQKLRDLYMQFGVPYNVKDIPSSVPAPSSATSTNRTSSGVKWSVQP